MNIHPPKSASRPATYADIETAPEHLVAEIIDGALVTHPRPSLRHAGSANAIAAKLTEPFQWGGGGGPGGWVFFVEPEVKLGEQILVPDIAGWRRERVTEYPDTNYFEIAPDWVCEVLSRSTEQRDRTIKTRIYAEAGVPYLWLLDPRAQVLETSTLKGGEWSKSGAWSSDDTVSAPPFDAVSFSLADLWPLDRPLGMNEDSTPYYAGDR